MPELPEVETVRRQLAPQLAGALVVEGWAFASPKFTDAPAVVGATLGAVRRRGKYLLVDTDDGRELVVHLGMTGRLAVESDVLDGPPGPHLRAWWSLADGRRLTFTDVRRFGRIAVVEAGHHGGLPTLAALGPEPFDDAFTPASLRAAVSPGRRAVKTMLLSQRVVAGVGNIYADEALWLARVDPRARRLGPGRARALHAAVRTVLADGLADGGTTLRDYRDARGDRGGHQERLQCYGRAGLPCPRCGRPLSHTVLDARSTTWCRSCQRP